MRLHDPQAIDRLFGIQSSTVSSDRIRCGARPKDITNDTFLFLELLSDEMLGDVDADVRSASECLCSSQSSISGSDRPCRD
jgi:hypothetical protein